MTAEKRTVRSEIREFFTEIQDGWRGWRTRARARNAIRNAERSKTIDRSTGPAIELEEHGQQEGDEITFTPLDPGSNPMAHTTVAGRPVAAVMLADSICPVTRQTIRPDGAAYQCRLCGIYYSPEGWEFLRRTARGECCGCRNINTVLPVVRVR